MQPLYYVCRNATATFGPHDIMTRRPAVAVKIAECIAEWADIETMIGLTLGLLLESEAKAAMAMYSSLDKRSAQRRMFLGAAESKLTADQYEVLTVIMQASIKPVMTSRDKLAHWCWGISDDLPMDLLLTHPDEKMTRHFMAVHLDQSFPTAELDTRKIFVVTEKFLGELADKLRDAKTDITEFAASVWSINSETVRAEYLQTLSNKPRIRSGLDRIADRRKKIQKLSNHRGRQIRAANRDKLVGREGNWLAATPGQARQAASTHGRPRPIAGQ